MVINWPEIGIQTAIIVILLAMVATYVRYRAYPKLKTAGAQWIGAAIGRFMQNLAEEAEKEVGEGGEGGGAGGGAFKIAGFEITPGLLQQGMQLLKFAQEMGWIKAGGGGAGGKMGL